MENTWYGDVTEQSLNEGRDFIKKYISENPLSALTERYFEELKNSCVYNTNAIEGNPVTEYDTAYILKSGTFLEGYTAKANMEVLGSGRAWDYVMTKPELTLDTLLEIHRRILFFDVEHAGVFRNIPVHVGDKQMLPPERIGEAMSALPVKYGGWDFFGTVAKTHLTLENIHPFVDGNGRAGRMFINLQLMHEGYLPINIKRAEAGRYYRCFRMYDISPEKGIQELYNIITKYEYDELMRLKGRIEADARKGGI